MSDGVYAWPRFSVMTRSEGDVFLIDVAGEIDVATSPRLRVALLGAIETRPPLGEVRVDLSRVTFIDAEAVGVLVTGRDAARRHGVAFAVQNPQGIVLRVLDILGLIEELQYRPGSTLRQHPTDRASEA